MAVQVYGVNHVVIEVDDAKKAVEFYADVFNLEMLRGGEGAAWCKLGEHQFLAIFEVVSISIIFIIGFVGVSTQISLVLSLINSSIFEVFSMPIK